MPLLKLYRSWHVEFDAVVCAKSGHEVRDIHTELSPDIEQQFTIHMSVIGIADKKMKRGIVVLKKK